KVVGEGGNLGFTQAGRIEYALTGGWINADFIDNSGGVDCSDREVNIKILLATVGLTGAERDKLLADMTDEVATLVLRANYHQAWALGRARVQAAPLLPALLRATVGLHGAERDELLADMSDEVATVVLRDNYRQAWALGRARVQAEPLLPVHRRMLTALERAGELDRRRAGLPTDAELVARA